MTTWRMLREMNAEARGLLLGMVVTTVVPELGRQRKKEKLTVILAM